MASPPKSASLPCFYGFDEAVVAVAFHEPEAGRRQVPEAFVQDLWQFQHFDRSGLRTAGGAPVYVLEPGTLNTDSGPDFTGARLRIGDVTWHGDVEIHTTSSGWFEHKHHLDARYNSVVLHVVLHADIWTGGLLREDGGPLPELILYPHLGAPLRALLHQFYTRREAALPCAESWQRVPAHVRDAWIRRMADERIQARQNRLTESYLQAPDLEMLLHERLFAGLGYSKNAEAMLSLARRIPLSLARRLEDPLDLEALHLGVAGLLPAPADLLASDRATADHVMGLRDRFERLNHRLELPVMARSTWRFFRLRPANFPPVRIVQGVALLRPDGLLRRDPLGRLAEAFRSTKPRTALHALLSTPPHPFWNNHVRLEKTTRPRLAALGRQRADALIVNAVVPVLLIYAEQTNDTALEAAVLDILRHIPASEDEVTRRFLALGTRADDALAAQGLHQLFRTRCSQARCLSCAIGQHILEDSR